MNTRTRPFLSAPTFRLLALLLAALPCLLLLPGCVQQQLKQQQRSSQVVVLDIGHYYEPTRGGQGARTPDARYGVIEECEFWYEYVIYTKQVIEKAGYTCRICNRGDTPTNAKLAAAARKAGVVQLRTPKPTGIYLSRHHPRRMAVGMLSADYALDQKPGCVVFLHHNSFTEDWKVLHKSAFYCNEQGGALAQCMAKVMDRDILDHGMPHGGVPCATIIRNDGRRGGGDWLNTCNDSYVPAVITEVGILSNPEHASFLSKKKNAIRFAEAVGQGIVDYMRSR